MILEQLKKIPIISVACEKVGVSRASVHRWRKDDPTFLQESEDAIREGIGYINDLGENQLLSLIGEKRMQAISFWLKHNHERYGAKLKPVVPAEQLSPGNPLHPKAKEIAKRYEEELRQAIVQEIHEKHP